MKIDVTPAEIVMKPKQDIAPESDCPLFGRLAARCHGSLHLSIQYVGARGRVQRGRRSSGAAVPGETAIMARYMSSIAVTQVFDPAVAEAAR